jgi:hypothetical protein
MFKGRSKRQLHRCSKDIASWRQTRSINEADRFINPTPATTNSRRLSVQLVQEASLQSQS